MWFCCFESKAKRDSSSESRLSQAIDRSSIIDAAMYLLRKRELDGRLSLSGLPSCAELLLLFAERLFARFVSPLESCPVPNVELDAVDDKGEGQVASGVTTVDGDIHDFKRLFTESGDSSFLLFISNIKSTVFLDSTLFDDILEEHDFDTDEGVSGAPSPSDFDCFEMFR